MRGTFGCLIVVGLLVPVAGVSGQFVPGGVDSVGLTTIVEDTVIPYEDTGALGDLGNWEPYASVVGNSVFVIESNVYAAGFGDKQNFAVALQKVDGGDPVFASAFYDDAGQPYPGEINKSRQNGNPGRVTGDKRPGAVFYMTGGEASPHAFPASFNSDGRWDRPVYGADTRYCAVQTFQLDVETLTAAPASNIFDSGFGRVELLDPPDSRLGSQAARFGGDLAGLSNGNFVSVIDDRSNHFAPVTSSTATIVASDGTIIKDSFVVAEKDLWSNVASYKNGFCVRVRDPAAPDPPGQGPWLKFYSNEGDFLGQTHQDLDAEGNAMVLDPLGSEIKFDTGRGDGTRIAAHINGPYVFLGGRATVDDRTDVRLAVYDSRKPDDAYVGQVNVNELTVALGGTDPDDPGSLVFDGADRANVAVDALNRIVVAAGVQLTGVADTHRQIVARVLAFDEDTETFSYLTNSFFPFVNFHSAPAPAAGDPIQTERPSPAMTTRQICVSGKGLINTDNQPDQGANSPDQLNFYVVISHPDPQDDPTPPVGPAPDCSTADSISPNLGTVGKVVENVTITGTNFVPGETSLTLLASGLSTISVPASAVDVSPDGTTATFDLDLAGADPGVRSVFIDTNCPKFTIMRDAFLVTPCFDPFADVNQDGSVDHTDYGAFQLCLGADTADMVGGCACMDRDGNDTVDLDDLTAFAACALGPGIPADPTCDD